MSDDVQIERYLNNELSAEERNAFELQMQQDASFAERVKIYTQIYYDIEDSGKELQLFHTLETNSKKYFQRNINKHVSPPTKIKRQKIVYITMAAAAIFLIFIIRMFFAGTQSAGEIFAEYNNFQKISFAQRSQENNDTLLLIENLYNNKKFDSALQHIILWNSLHSDTEIKMLEGHTLLFLNKYSDAINIFKEVSYGASSFKNEALYFTGLAYLGKGETDSCLVTLKAIPVEAGVYSKSAEIIRKIEKQ